MTRRTALLFIVLMLAALSSPARADQYEHEWNENGFHLLELREDGVSDPLFTIERIEYVAVGLGQLKIYVNAESRDAIRAALDSGSLTAEIADGQGSTPVELSLTQECRCSGSTIAYGSAYSGQSCEAHCGDAGVEDEQYYFRVFTPLNAGTDLAIGLDPTQIWLIERQ